jgi:hypothetical protein
MEAMANEIEQDLRVYFAEDFSERVFARRERLRRVPV